MIALLFVLSAAPEIRMDEGSDAAIVLLAPFGPSHTGASTIIAAASRAFEADTDLRLLPAQQVGIDVDRMVACPADGRLTCWVALGAESKVKLLLIVTTIVSGGEDSVAMTLLDLDVAREYVGSEEAEQRIFEGIAEVRPRAMPDPEQTFREVVAGELRPFLESRGHFHPYGEAAIETDCTGCALLIGETSVGVLETGTTRLSALRPGTVELSVMLGSEPLCVRQLQISAGELARARCDVDAFDPNDGLLYGAIAAGVLGAAGMSWSLALLAGADQICVARDDSGCRYVRLPRSGFRSHKAIEEAEDINAGVPIFQVGAGLLAAGATWLVGSLIAEPDWWWLTLASGIALGSVTGGLLFLAD